MDAVTLITRAHRIAVGEKDHEELYNKMDMKFDNGKPPTVFALDKPLTPEAVTAVIFALLILILVVGAAVVKCCCDGECRPAAEAAADPAHSPMLKQ
ncbi:hypothetical protein PENTCL1PPCAC_7938 [Pristionchus entomophagus]|uniref:Uncharacterized protein n=1 Tax=Pristionchus entomophagus TaxID=358040 RepID=A0AAV5SUK3_9BILA|nr:hypothetical protein PENTCL1PPCAC_7938 [Pristionchus entomophagus]